jgi:esterase/lipase
VIIPVNITYFPIRARDNAFVRLASTFAKDLSKRAVEELSVEGTVLADDTDVDITLGEPIDVREYLNAPEFAEVMACGLDDMRALEEDPGSLFNDAARKLMQRYMHQIYQLTTVNHDHLFATVLKYQEDLVFTERSFRNRVFLLADALNNSGEYRMHELLRSKFRDLVYEDPSLKFNDFMSICVREGLLSREGNRFTRNPNAGCGTADFHTARFDELSRVIANEAEPLSSLQEIARQVARMQPFLLSKRIRDAFIKEDQRIFEDDYAKYFNVQYSKGQDVGRPYLLKPMHPKGGIVLCHGYMAAPQEVRALAEYLYQQNYAVYGVRMRGHGTAPEDLAQTNWEQWYESFNRGYAIIKSLTEEIILGGFSTGGCLALLAAARKGVKAQAVFCICSPLQLRNTSARFAPSMVTINSLLRRIGRTNDSWEYVDNSPENPHINYMRNPVKGVRELISVMAAMETALPQVRVPALVMQASKDPTVSPISAQAIYEGLGSEFKELMFFERYRHGIVNGAGREHVFACIDHFLQRAPRHSTMEELAIEEEAPSPPQAKAAG